MKNIYEINALLQESGESVEFHLSISRPLLSLEGNDYYCKVHCPILFENDKDIYGVDEAQAKELAVEFAIRMLRGRRLVDMDAKFIDLERSLRAFLNRA